MMNASLPQVLVVGPVSWNTLVYLDALPEPQPHTVFARRSVQTLGGTSAGKALNLDALGAPVTLRTVLGQDSAASAVRDVFAQTGVRFVAEDVVGPSESHLNLMDPHGGRVSIYLTTTTLPELTGPSLDLARQAVQDCDVLVADLTDHARPYLALAQELGRPVWCDVHDYDGTSDFHQQFVDAADVLFLNADGFARHGAVRGLERFMEDRVSAGTAAVVVTEGAQGARSVTFGGAWHQVDAEPVEHIVDTNGAGDAFFAGVLDHVLRHARTPDAVFTSHTWQEALKAGATTAAACLRSPDLVGTSADHQP